MKKNLFVPVVFLFSFFTASSQATVETIKKIGKKNFITIGYSIPMGTSKSSFPGINSYNEAVSFFNGQHSGGLGADYSLNLSIADAQINLYTNPQYKISLDWNILDAEYSVFDWSNNTFVRKDDPSGSAITELRSFKGGTRIGPAVTYLLSDKVAIAGYYSARPGVQFILDELRINPSPTTSYTITPERMNYNFSNEVGIKFHFFNKFSIIPYYHFGKYNWKSIIQNATGGSGGPLEVQANYPFSFVGVRLGVL